jgi:2-keto-4-pentenoate hydratase/2-oxohepta-3-ene-1,7-dioic acid hydratase in catechol pathway
MIKNMTFAVLRDGNEYSLGIKTDRGVLNARKAGAALQINAPATIDEVIAGRGDGAALAQLVQKASAATDQKALFVDEQSAPFGPCVPHPGKIVCVGLNYRKHAAETGMPIPPVPILFSKFNNALAPHRGTVNASRGPTEKLDYEAELVIVIGKTARAVAETDALSYVFGYCVGNDVSARDLQMRTTQWLVGKTYDGYAPIGPYLVTADQVPDPNALKIECRVNGETRQSSNTADMIFGCARLLAYTSRYIPLDPGDIIFTGTPEGVALGQPKDKQVWLKPGDRVSTYIEKLGTLEFTVD